MQSNAFKRRVVEEQYTVARSTFMRTRLGVLIVIIFIMGPEGGGGGGGPDPQDPLAGSALVSIAYLAIAILPAARRHDQMEHARAVINYATTISHNVIYTIVDTSPRAFSV